VLYINNRYIGYKALAGHGSIHCKYGWSFNRFLSRETLFQFKDTSIKNKNDSFHIQ